MKCSAGLPHTDPLVEARYTFASRGWCTGHLNWPPSPQTRGGGRSTSWFMVCLTPLMYVTHRANHTAPLSFQNLALIYRLTVLKLSRSLSPTVHDCNVNERGGQQHSPQDCVALEGWRGLLSFINCCCSFPGMQGAIHYPLQGSTTCGDPQNHYHNSIM